MTKSDPPRPLLAWPITATFGDHCRREPPSLSPGLDLATPAGTALPSPCDGRVYAFRWSEMGGRTLVLIDGLERQWWLLHLSGALVSVGERVKRGQAVALSGNTGRHTTGPHVHVCLRVAGAWVDPMPLLQAPA